jgi:hypothetical protein
MTAQRWFLGLALLVGSGLLACLTSTAAEKDTAKKTAEEEVLPADPGTDPVARIQLASRLIEYGRATKSPGSLINAASILRSIPGEKLKKDKPTTLDAKGEKVESAGAPAETPNLAEQAEAVLKEAKGMVSGTDKKSVALAALADAILGDKLMRGAQGGPKYIQNNLRPGQSDVWNLKFDKGRSARVAVRSPGGRLGLVVTNYDHQTRSTDGGPNPVATWMPHQNDGVDYHVRVKNNGSQTIWYQLYTN